MRRTTLFHSSLNFLIASFFVLIGFLCLLLPWITSLRNAVITLFVNHAFLMSLLAAGFILVGISMFLTLFYQRRQYYQLKTGLCSVTISQSLLDDYISQYWETRFPQQEFVSNVEIEDNHIAITADLPHLPFEKQREFLTQAEKDLSALLADKVGYHQGFSLSVSFFDINSPISRS